MLRDGADMADAMEEAMAGEGDWLEPWHATFGNRRNSFSGEGRDPIIVDYIFYRSNVESVKVSTYTYMHDSE